MEKSIHSKSYARFIELLRKVREERGLTQDDIATAIGESQSFVSKCERGERRLDVIELTDFCKALGIPLDEFSARLIKVLKRR